MSLYTVLNSRLSHLQQRVHFLLVCTMLANQACSRDKCQKFSSFHKKITIQWNQQVQKAMSCSVALWATARMGVRFSSQSWSHAPVLCAFGWRGSQEAEQAIIWLQYPPAQGEKWEEETKTRALCAHTDHRHNIQKRWCHISKPRQATMLLCLVSTLPWRWPEHSSFFKFCPDMHLKNLNNHTSGIKSPPCGNILHLPLQRRSWKRLSFLTVNCTSPLHSPLEREV